MRTSQVIVAVVFWAIFAIPLWLTIAIFVAGRKRTVRK